MIKITKWVKDFSYRERWEKLGLNALLKKRIKGDIIEIFKMINRIS